MKYSKGFSLIELVIVIVVIGVLAAAALPRFIQVTDEAKVAALEGMAGGFATAVLSARAQWEATGRPRNSAGINQVNYDGTVFTLTSAESDGSERDGYPFALENGIADVDLVTAKECQEMLDNLLQNPPRSTRNASNLASGNYRYFVSKDSEGGTPRCLYYQLASQTAGENSGSSNATNGHYFSYRPAIGRIEVHLN
ncbi:prepilin-type N-terminal cleavage/methylation domain-containing protein [Parasalinivibrio latis]|uniref:prepilin-type N-terminal cleavage/methylation domain-containing protein n=1 Tax=Parasalinivibrio latis TaxID=2952610 RepID=UPI0030E43978